jgi:hypothetical protein
MPANPPPTMATWGDPAGPKDRTAASVVMRPTG